MISGQCILKTNTEEHDM